MIEYRKYITRQMLRDEPEKLFVFGDNMVHRGLGGQAKEMRGEPNAVGIPTKRFPSMTIGSFLRDSDWYEWKIEATPAIERLAGHVGTIVWPEDGIGTGLAQLEHNSPLIWSFIQRIRFNLERR